MIDPPLSFLLSPGDPKPRKEGGIGKGKLNGGQSRVGSAALIIVSRVTVTHQPGSGLSYSEWLSFWDIVEQG